jgi:hypothetical protein
MPKLARTTYRLELEGRDDTPEVTPILADILRGELEGPKHGITDPQRYSIHTTVLWLWSACLRDKLFDGGFQEFKAALLNFEPVKPAGVEVQGVPPTSPAEPLSSSPATTDTPDMPARGSSSSSGTRTRSTRKRSSS